MPSGEEVRPLQIVIPIFEGVTPLDAIGPYEFLHRLPNTRIFFVAEQPGHYNCNAGTSLTIQVHHSFLDFPNPDIILVPGGPGTGRLLQPNPLLDWVRKAHETSIYTTSVCTGSHLLAAAGILDGLEATTHWNTFDLLGKLGARPVSRRIVQQGKIMTAAGVSAGIDMAIQLAALLRGEEIAKMLQLIIEYDPQPPYDVGSVEKAGEELVERARAFLAKASKPNE